MTRANMLLLMSGSIACAKASSLVSEWVKLGHRVRVACTASVSNFIGRATLEGLSGSPVFDDTFEAGKAMEHINLTRWADVIVACPASSNLINKLASGIADEAVSTLWQAAWARGKPMIVVPAMNTSMWNYPATRESVEKLTAWGIHVFPAAEGELACGENGEGRMLEPAEILRRIDRLLAFNSDSKSCRILVTAGGTREAIDAVRYIGNLSTGRTARVLSDELVAAGHRVTWLGAEDAERPHLASKRVNYRSFSDLQQQLQFLLGKDPYDLVIHAAAVSDYSVSGVEMDGNVFTEAGKHKLPSDGTMTIQLRPNPKLLERIREFSCNPDLRVIGFKLTSGAGKEQVTQAVEQLFSRSALVAVVHNDLDEIKAGRHCFSMHRVNEKPRYYTDSHALAGGIHTLLEN